MLLTQHENHPYLTPWPDMLWPGVMIEQDHICLIRLPPIRDDGTCGHWTLLLDELPPTRPHPSPGGNTISHQDLLLDCQEYLQQEEGHHLIFNPVR